MIRISDEDIEYAEKLFLPKGIVFDEKRRAVIRCMESKNIIACPGSGKTTVLLAKLAILARKLPLDGNRGLCVLAHTNVALNEIRTRLGTKGNVLLGYPNFFGTIQSFVNRYLTVPYYSKLFGQAENLRIDNDIYSACLMKGFYRLPITRRYYIERQYESNLSGFLTTLCFSHEDLNVLINGSNQKPAFPKPNKDYAIAMYELKRTILEQGVLSYADAYALGFALMRENGLYFREALSRRFAFLFIDEAQDTDMIQQRLIDESFNKELVVVQKIGDPNQAIFESVGSDSVTSFLSVSGEESLPINGSKRFSRKIACQVRKLCVVQQDVGGNDNIPDITPRLIVFEDHSICGVIDRFAHLVVDEGLLELERKVFKAIGLVGKNHNSERTIPSYWSEYNKGGLIVQNSFTLSGMMGHSPVSTGKCHGSNFYFESVLQVLLRVIQMSSGSGVEANSVFSLKHYLARFHPALFEDLRYNISSWLPVFYDGGDCVEEIRMFVRKSFLPVLGLTETSDLTAFLDAELARLDGTLGKSPTNVLSINVNGNLVDVEVSTVHAVKGETHSATLFLETFWYGYDVKELIEYLAGNWQATKKKRQIARLRTMYVGVSRPTHLLCVGVHEKSISGYEESLKNAGWQLEYV